MGERSLRDVIDQRIEQLVDAGERRNSPSFRYLMRLSDLVDQGVVLTIQDREFLDKLKPNRKIRRCERVGPTGKCPDGYGSDKPETMDRCPHWGRWTKNDVTCVGYEPEIFRSRRF